MFDIGLKEIHIGKAIDKRREDLNMTKTEFGRQIGIRQQHVNKIFENESIETGKLVKICHILNFNFFTLYCNLPNVSANLSSIALGDGNAQNIIGDTAIASQLELQKQKIEDMTENKEILKDQIETLKSQVKLLESTLLSKDNIINDKDYLIKMLKEKD